MRLLQELAADISFALHHLDQKARMDYLACHDSLTDLPNRSLFADRMAQALSAARRERRFAAAVFLDVERFRMVNETLGRKAGDELLREVGRRLRAAAREQDTVARVGADHFAIAVAGFDHPGDTTHWFIERLERAFATSIDVEGTELLATLKAGVAVFPTDGETPELLCANAETALRKAKESSQRYLFYAPHMNAQVAESLALENRLRRALDEGKLALHYQPKVDLHTGALAGLEALIRWHDSELGVVPPARFVQLMEETGMILAAGRWALGRAVADIRHWQRLGLRVPRTSVNVSALQLRQDDFTDSVLKAIAPFGEQVPLLDLEITESVLVDEDCTRKLQVLRHTGIEVAVDDFGTGYCSLELPRQAAGRHPEDRPQLRRAHARGGLPAQHRGDDRVARAHPRPQGGRRGRGGGRADAHAARPRLRPDPGLPGELAAARGAGRVAAAQRAGQGDRGSGLEIAPPGA